jgi:hypothetical protein
MPAKKKAAAAIPPETFFATVVPRLLSIMRATCKDMGGRYVIAVDGAGAWTLDFPTAAVQKGAGENVDVTVHLTPEQFASLSSASVELAKLVASKAVRCEGDVGKIENVSLVLAFLSR